jgi:VWFA-related protein
LTRPIVTGLCWVWLASAAFGPVVAAATTAALLPEDQRAFLDDGPGLLLTEEQRRELLTLPAEARPGFVQAFLRDPFPDTALDELAEAIARRRRVAFTVADTPLDPRWQLAFLRGLPDARLVVTCSAGFRPVEVWEYTSEPGQAGGSPEVRRVLLYQPSPTGAWRWWAPPIDTKWDLYTEEMASFMEQWERYDGRLFNAVRFDFQLCREDAELLDLATGVHALTDERREPKLLPSPFAPPASPADWAREALAEEAPAAPPPLAVQDVEIFFPARQGSDRIVTRILVTLAPGATLGVDTEGEMPKVRFEVDGVVEQNGKVFDRLRVRYAMAPPLPGVPVPLVVEVPLRPGRGFLVRLHVRDPLGGGEARLARAFVVADEPQPVPELPVTAVEIEQLERELEEQVVAGADSLLLVPPLEDVVLGRWRAEALVSGERIVAVAMFLDGKKVLEIRRRPFSAELPLDLLPQEHVVRAEGYDAEGNLVAADEVVVNMPRGNLRVRIMEPRRGAVAAGRTRVKAIVVVPEGKTVEKVEFRLGEQVMATDHAPPWEQWVEVPPNAGLTYLSVVATLGDGQFAEDVRFLGGGGFAEELEVDLVELYTAVVDRSGRLVSGLVQDDFTVLEDGRPQEVRRFEVAEDVPLAIGICMDTSGSMEEEIEEAKRAAIGFLEAVVRRGDRSFAVTFSDQPRVLHAPTEDVSAVVDLLGRQRAHGWTALHDAILTSLYYFRGLTGQKALILLSDGDDTRSKTAFRQALEYARRGGVAVYPIGLGVDTFGFAIREKLQSLADETGGKVFYLERADQLAGVYAQIEEELRTRYLLAYVSDRPEGGEGELRKIEVKVKKRGLEARTMRGYTP